MIKKPTRHPTSCYIKPWNLKLVSCQIITCINIQKGQFIQVFSVSLKLSWQQSLNPKMLTLSICCFGKPIIVSISCLNIHSNFRIMLKFAPKPTLLPAPAHVSSATNNTLFCNDIQMIVLPTNEDCCRLFLTYEVSSKCEWEGRYDSWLHMASAVAICCLRFRKLPSVCFENGDTYVRLSVVLSIHYFCMTREP